MRRFRSKPSSGANQSSATKSQQTSSSQIDNDSDDEELTEEMVETVKQRLLAEYNIQCSICLDIAKDSVVSMCGHMFCWPCLHQWLQIRTDDNSQFQRTCPVCKSAISREKVIPIYGPNGNKEDPRDKLPPKPSGQWTEAPNNQFTYNNVWAMGGTGAQLFNFGDGGFHMTFGFGSLPQYILAFLHEYTTNDRRNETDFFLMKFFAICGFLCIVLTLYFC